ncbi:MAG TPA: amidohydrolase family protein, partial [Dehalococcoidia bacterium]|nr:amidohydrolase family protein [Dehalococcoidia bacterium]
MPEYDLLIQGGMIIDGMRAPRYRGDLAIKDGRIAEIGRLPAHSAKRVLDAGGAIVAPGFVDLHTHYDAQIFWDPYLTISSWHGITSVMIGNCGFGFAPVRPEMRERSMLTMTRVEAIPLAAMKAAMTWDWVTFPEFLDKLDELPKGVNILPLMPVSPLLTWVMGLEAAKTRHPTADEEREICRLLREAMEAGACGWSAQRTPPTGPFSVQRDYDGTPMVSDVMADETCLALANVLGERNAGCIQLTLFTGNFGHDWRHFEELAEVSARPVLYNVIQANDRRPELHRRGLAWLEENRAKGRRIYGQGVTTAAFLTFTFEDWNLFDDSQAWCDATTGSFEEKLVKLADPDRRPGLKAQVPVNVGFFDETVVFETYQPQFKHYENLTLREIGEREDKHPVDVMCDLAVADNLRTVFYIEPINTRLDLLKEIATHDLTLFGVSDGGAHTKFLTAGRYPTEVLSKFVRDENWMSLEEAHWRLSALPAWCAGFRNRGTLQEGAA